MYKLKKKILENDDYSEKVLTFASSNLSINKLIKTKKDYGIRNW